MGEQESIVRELKRVKGEVGDETEEVRDRPRSRN